MTLSEILGEFSRRGITLTAREGELITRPLSAAPPELRALARQHRSELLAALAPALRKDRACESI